MTTTAPIQTGPPPGSPPPVTPERINRLVWGFAPPLVIHSAIENGIFDALDRGPKTAAELAAELGASERGVAALMGGLTAFELVAKQADGRYRLAPDAAAFLVRSKPGFHGGIIEQVHSSVLPSWMTLAEITRSGIPESKVNQPEIAAQFFEHLVDGLFPMNYPAALALAQALERDRSTGETKGAVNSPVRVLDLAAGSGVWGIAQAQASPRVQVTALDFENVLKITRRNAERFGLASRFEFLAGDMRTADYGKGYSLAILGHILHSEGAKQSRALLERVFAALEPGGTIAIAEFLVNQERTGPPMGLIFAINMLVHTTEGDTFSFEEISSWLKSAGFERMRTLDAPGPSPMILANKPK